MKKIVQFQKPIKRGDLWYARLIGEGSMQVGVRPVVIISNDKNNFYSPNVTVIPLTSKTKKLLPTHVLIEPNENNGLTKPSVSLAEASTTISKSMLIDYIGRLDDETMQKINRTILIQNGLLDVIEM